MENAQPCRQGSAASSSAAGSSPGKKHLPGSAQLFLVAHSLPFGLRKPSGQAGRPPSWESMGVCVTAHGGVEGRRELDHVSSTVL